MSEQMPSAIKSEASFSREHLEQHGVVETPEGFNLEGVATLAPGFDVTIEPTVVNSGESKSFSTKDDAREDKNDLNRRHPAESLFGFDNDTKFSESIQTQLVEENINNDNKKSYGYNRENDNNIIQNIFDTHGLNINPGVMNINDVKGFSETDWKEAEASPSPVLRLLSRRTLGREIHKAKFYPQLRGEDLTLKERATLRSLPLVHGMTAQSFFGVLESGALVTNRQLYIQSQKEAVDFIKSKVGNTLAVDRKLGLDNYIFADFARPNSLRSHTQPEILLVLDPDVLQQEGAFLTEKDIADCGYNGVSQISEYVDGLITPEDFYDIAELRIPRLKIEEVQQREGYYSIYNTINEFASGQDSNPINKFASGQDNNPTNVDDYSFSTWEAKLPKASLSMVRKIIVKNRDHYDDLLGLGIKDIEIVYSPNLSHGDEVERSQYEELRISGRKEAEFEKLVHEDYLKRKAIIDKLSNEELTELLMVFPKGLDPIQEYRVTIETNPYGYKEMNDKGGFFVSQKEYHDMNTLVKDAGLAIQCKSVDHVDAIRDRQIPHWLLEKEAGSRFLAQPIKNDFVLARYICSKNNHSVGVINEFEITNLQKLISKEGL